MRLRAVLVFLPILVWGASAPQREAKMHLTTTAFAQQARIPAQFTEDGQDVSPALSWSGAPTGTQAFALVMEDPDAPVGTWIHWVLYDLPVQTLALPQGQARTATLSSGAKQGKNSWGKLGYNGPAPPPGKPHRYFFRLYALSAPTGLVAGVTRPDLDRAMKGKVLGEATWMGTYQR